MTSKKKITLAAVLVLVMVVSAVGGTLAYLTDSASLDNTFLVGAFTPPTDPDPNPDPPGPGPNPDPYPDPVTPTDGKVNSYIYEPYWNSHGDPTWESGTVTPDNHRLLAGETTVKDPYIGIGKDSESGYVLACITNPMRPYVYFTLGEGWEPVAGCVNEVTITADNGSNPAVTSGSPKFYSDGLFKWVGTNTDGTLKALNPDTDNNGKGDSDVWTDHPVFSYVYTAKNGLDEVKGLEKADQKMTVWAYIAQTKGTQEGNTTEITPDYVITQAIAWAQKAETGYPGWTVVPTTP